jgi:uncharacterized protein YbjQ (UPF0145 family)
MEGWIQLLFNLGLPLLVLVGAYFTGTAIERRHYRSLRVRENASRRFLAITFPYVPEDQTVVAAELVTGSVVVSIDHFKRFLAGLRMLFGGRVTSYETLLDRGRREAIMRLKENSRQRGFQAVVNVRLETSRLASSRGDKGTAGVEVLAFGTALRFAR